MIGTLGRKIIFEVSDNRVLTFESMSREVSGRWTEHEVLGVKPKAEFLGPGLQTISLTIHLSAALGVKPRRILDMVERMVERGGVPGDRRQTGGPPSVPRHGIE
jgi:phage protein U